ncbi:transmembrane protein 184B-like [Hibiscus syriacus]|uniref:transmembrane protein 184B-like n=1 Tax=Hibiscus syriacus TaxID=106335 RepID=UPI001921CF95|nr:transmembrane protein 184B-like [Hibiscus syriacus]
MGDSFPNYLDVLALLCTAGAVWLAVLHIYRHLLNYTEPIFQRYIVRIIFMVPVYALMSFLSLVLPRSSIYFNSFREGYEAWVIYNFLSLCLAWVGGPGAVVLSLTGRVLKPSWFLMTCCLPPVPLDGRFIRRCKQGCLQFVILKPILVAVTLILYAKGKYEDGNFSPNQSYLYLTIIYTISYTSALYALVLFYMACKDLLKPFNPVPKFIIIKSVVFLTYWQGVLFFLAAKSGFIKGAEEAAQFQNFLICVEMLIAAVGHLYAFPYKEYAGANIGVCRDFTRSLAHALMLNDFYHDTVHQFAPTYHDYVLYNHNDGDEGTRKYRSRTFVPTGPEMDAARRNKHAIPNKLEDIQLSALPSYGTGAPQNPSSVPESASADVTKSSLLMDHSNSYSMPYDMSLMDMDLSGYPSAVPAAKDINPR